MKSFKILRWMHVLMKNSYEKKVFLMIRKISKIYTVFLILIIMILFFLFKFNNIFNYLISYPTHMIQYELIHNHTLNNCKNQFHNNNAQYYVEIDNEVYPKFVPKMFNKTIDFACLNNNTKRNRILLWTKFIGSDDFFYGIFFCLINISRETLF